MFTVLPTVLLLYILFIAQAWIYQPECNKFSCKKDKAKVRKRIKKNKQIKEN